ncbi:MAG: GGDEF domain-containing protein [Anaerolineales bacterium]|jgi:diguanylate cyclase
MDPKGLEIRDEITDRLFAIYDEENTPSLSALREMMAPEADRLSHNFYDSMLGITEAGFFLNHSLVSERLHKSLANWIRELFQPVAKLSVAEHIKAQKTVGDVHARINVPMRLVNHGIRLIKWEMDEIISKAPVPEETKLHHLIIVNDLLHFSSSLINESYVGFRVETERDEQALRMNVMSFSLVIEIERLRSSLFDWLRKAVTEIYQLFPDNSPRLSSIYSSEFGLWVNYKAEFIFADRPDLIQKLKSQLSLIEADIDSINKLEGENAKTELTRTIESINDHISNTAWLLADFSSQAYEYEVGRDPLTRLFNRRFLPTILQNVIKTSKNTLSVFSVLLCDIDNFKEINDQYGHDAGDQILVDFGEFLAVNVRVTDYVFRMGGDEFLVLLVGANSEESANITNKILSLLYSHRFTIDQHQEIPVQVSMGIVESDGHPDYLRMMKRADEALYKAKRQGKGTVYINNDMS